MYISKTIYVPLQVPFKYTYCIVFLLQTVSVQSHCFWGKFSGDFEKTPLKYVSWRLGAALKFSIGELDWICQQL